MRPYTMALRTGSMKPGNDPVRVMRERRVGVDVEHPEQNRPVSVVGRERAGVELLVEVSLALISQAIEASRNPFNQTVPPKDREAISGVVTDGDAKVVNGPRREVPLVAHQLQDLVVDGVHPVRALSHALFCGCDAHIDTGVRVTTPYYSLSIPSQGVKSPRQRVVTP